MRAMPMLYGVTMPRFVWADIADTKLTSDLNDLAAGALMGLADDAITNAKFDEGTAYPLKAADTGATILARTGDAMALTGAYDAAKAAAPVGAAMALTSAYDAAKTAAPVGAAMTLTGAYDAAKVAAPVGAAMTLTGAYDAAKTAAQAGALTTHDGKLDTVDANVDAILLDTGTDGVKLMPDAVNAGTVATDALGALELAADAAQEIADAVCDEALAGHATPGTVGKALSSTQTLGAGAITWTYTLTSTVPPYNPIADADVWVSTDPSGNNVIASGKTNAYGVVTFHLDAGLIYVWAAKTGFTFTCPDLETVA